VTAYQLNLIDFKHLLWDCGYSACIWREVEKQITERHEIKNTIKMKVRQTDSKYHMAINTIIMVIKKNMPQRLAMTQIP
jgi:hypothetical protein